MVVAKRLYEIARREFHVVELCEIKNMRLREHRRVNIKRLTDVSEIIEEMRIGQFFFVFIYKLFTDSSVCD